MNEIEQGRLNVRIQEILDFADPNHPNHFWRKQRAKAKLMSLIVTEKQKAVDEYIQRNERDMKPKKPHGGDGSWITRA